MTLSSFLFERPRPPLDRSREELSHGFLVHAGGRRDLAV
jgi:hypothetical protein